jgi:hypothetical protein
MEDSAAGSSFRTVHTATSAGVMRKDKLNRFHFCCNMFERMEMEDEFLEGIVFSDGTVFHVGGKVNKHNVRIENRT